MDELEQSITALLLCRSFIGNRADALVCIYLEHDYGYTIRDDGCLTCWHIIVDSPTMLLDNPQRYIVQYRHSQSLLSVLRRYRQLKMNVHKLASQYDVSSGSYHVSNVLGNETRYDNYGLRRSNLFTIPPEQYSGPFLLGALEAAMLLLAWAKAEYFGDYSVIGLAKERMELILTEITRRAYG